MKNLLCLLLWIWQLPQHLLALAIWAVLRNTNKIDRTFYTADNFFIVLIGISSAVFNNLWDRLFHRNWSTVERNKWYYNRYPENWADKLGGVVRI